MPEDPLKRAAESLEKAAQKLADIPTVIVARQGAAATAGGTLDATAVHPPDVRARLEARRAELQAQREAAQARAQAGGGPGDAAGGSRAETVRMRAEARHLASPQGQAQLQAQRQSERQNAQARQAQARGEGPGVVDTFTRSLGAAVPYLRAFQQAVGFAESAIVGLGSKASPTHGATFQSSLDLLQAKIGQSFVQPLETLSKAAQLLAQHVPDPKSTAGKSVSAAFDLSLYLPYFQKQIQEQKLKIDLSQLPGGSIQGAEQYSDRLTQAALRQDELQAQLLQVQLQALESLKGIWTELARQQPADPRFR